MTLTKVSGSILKDPLNLGGQVSIGGTLTYEDVTNVDSIGIITARSGINVSGGQVDIGSNVKIGNAGIGTFAGINLGDNEKINLGVSNDFKIYHNTVANSSSPPNHLYPNSNYIDAVAAGNLFIRTSTAGIYLGRTDGFHAASFHTNGSAVLYHNASGGGGERFRTVAGGIDVTGDVTLADSIIHDGDTDTKIRFPAADTISFETGGGERLRITSDGDVAIGRDAALANYSDGSTTTTQLAVVKDGGGAGSGYHEVAHFAGGTDSNDTGAIVRITQFNNDRGMFIKGGRGTSDQAKALIGMRDSGATDGNWITLTQNVDQITCHKSVDIDNGVNLSLGGTSGTHAPLHVKSENTGYGKNAVFGANGWVNNANYHYPDATITLLGRDRDNNDKGAGIEFCVRNTGDSNWNHGALTMARDGAFRLYAGGAGTTNAPERFILDANGNSKLGSSTPTAFTGSAPNHTQRFIGKKCMQGSVTSTATTAGNGTGTFDLGRLWLVDDSVTEIFLQIMRNDNALYNSHYCKAFIQKVRGSGMTQGNIQYQNGAHSGFSVSGIQAGGYTASGGSSHGTQISVTGGHGGVIYRMTCFYTTISKNDMY